MIANRSTYGRLIIICPVILLCLQGCNWGDIAELKMSASEARVSARRTLDVAVRDSNPSNRWMAIEALAQTVGSKSGRVFLEALSDPNPAVRSAAAMAIGDVRYEPAKATLKARAESKGTPYWETDRRAYCGVIYALYMLGDTDSTEQLGKLLWDKENQVRATAALVMGKMRETSAVSPLKMLLEEEQDPLVQVSLMEALAVLGDKRSARLLEAHAKTRFVDEQMMAIQAMACARCPRAKQVITEKLNDKHPPRVRVVAAGALARIGIFDRNGYNLCIKSVKNPARVLTGFLGLHSKVEDIHAESLQQLAAVSLGWMGHDGAVDYLYPLLKSDEGAVRIAAAMSILRLLPKHARNTRNTETKRWWRWRWPRDW